MRKILKITGSFVLAAAGLYMIDATFDVGPVVCKIDPTCRNLTEDEIATAKPIFGDTIRYKDVRVFERYPVQTYIADILTGETTRANSHHDNLYLPPLDGHPKYDDEKSLSEAENFNGFADRRTLVHELAHVSKNHTPFADNKSNQEYLFNIEPGRSFASYGPEQQAEIAATYYTLVRDYGRIEKLLAAADAETVSSHHRMMQQFCRDLDIYAEVMRPAFPATLPQSCQKPSLP